MEVSELFPCNPILERSIHYFVERHPRPLFETKLPIKYSILHHKHSKQDREEEKQKHHRKELSTRRCLQITCSTWYILIFSLMNSNVSNHDVVFWRHKCKKYINFYRPLHISTTHTVRSYIQNTGCPFYVRVFMVWGLFIESCSSFSSPFGGQGSGYLNGLFISERPHSIMTSMASTTLNNNLCSSYRIRSSWWRLLLENKNEKFCLQILLQQKW